MTDADKVDAIKFAVKRFDEIECVHVEKGHGERREDCPGCLSPFLKVIRDVIEGHGLPAAPRPLTDAEFDAL